MTASIIPSANDTFDIGSADYKIRDLYVADSSIWIGDEHKLSTASGTMKIMKRKKNAVPGAITAAGGNAAGALAHSGRGSLSDLKIQEWLAYAKSISGSFTKMTDVFRPTEDNDWEETDKPATDLTGASLRIDASTNSPTTGDVLQWTANNKFEPQTITGSDVTTKGDLQTYSTQGDRLPVGTDGKVLTANSTEATGLSWETTSSSYGNSDVDSHLNQSNPTSGHVLSWDGSDYNWVAQTGTWDGILSSSNNSNKLVSQAVVSSAWTRDNLLGEVPASDGRRVLTNYMYNYVDEQYAQTVTTNAVSGSVATEGQYVSDGGALVAEDLSLIHI